MLRAVNKKLYFETGINNDLEGWQETGNVLLASGGRLDESLALLVDGVGGELEAGAEGELG